MKVTVIWRKRSGIVKEWTPIDVLPSDYDREIEFRMERWEKNEFEVATTEHEIPTPDDLKEAALKPALAELASRVTTHRGILRKMDERLTKLEAIH